MNDVIFWEKEKIRINTYRAQKKENHYEAEKMTQCQKERPRIQKHIFKKIQKQMSDNNNMEAADPMNIANPYKFDNL